jgi:hypothetical protein
VLATLRRRLRARLLPEEAGVLQQPAVGGVNSQYEGVLMADRESAHHTSTVI